MAAKAFGAGKVAVVDMNETNLEVRHADMARTLPPLACAAEAVRMHHSR